jgi:hypothetical protein
LFRIAITSVALSLIAPVAFAQASAAQGDTAMAAGNYADAGAAYRRAYDETSDPTYLKKSGQAYMAMGSPGRDQAIESFRGYVQNARSLEEAQEGDGLLQQAQAIPAEGAAAPQPVTPQTDAPVPAGPPAGDPVADPPTGGEGDDAGKNDHQKVVGSVGIGWLGVSNIPLAFATPGLDAAGDPTVNGFAETQLAAPAVGARIWFSELVGLDVGLGLHFSSGSTEANNISVDKAPRFGMLIHAGVPLAFTSGEHVAFLLIPELNFAFATSEVDSPLIAAPAPPPAELSGLRVDVGARSGLEVHFGFMGLPELSLEGTVGIFLTNQSTSASVGNAKISDSDLLITTTSFDSPWDIFRTAVAARYYF